MTDILEQSLSDLTVLLQGTRQEVEQLRLANHKLEGECGHLRKALYDLVEQQEGPPSPKFAADWHAAMAQAVGLLSRNEANTIDAAFENSLDTP